MALNKKLHIMIDLETLGTKDNSPVIQIGAVFFDMNKGPISTFNEYLDLTDETLEVNMNTLKFWLDTDPDYLKSMIENKNGKSYKVLWSSFSKWISECREYASKKAIYTIKMNDSNKRKIVSYDELSKLQPDSYSNKKQIKNDVEIWGNGISFDITKVKYNLTKLDLPFDVDFWNERDVRTFLELTSEILGITEYKIKNSVKNSHAHDGLADAIYQMEYVQNAYKALQNLIEFTKDTNFQETNILEVFHEGGE